MGEPTRYRDKEEGGILHEVGEGRRVVPNVGKQPLRVLPKGWSTSTGELQDDEGRGSHSDVSGR